MKHATLALIAIGIVVISTISEGQTPPATAPVTKGDLELKTADQKSSYAIGLNLARSIKSQGVNVDPDLLARGIKDGLAGKPALTDQQVIETLQALEQQIAAKRNAMMTETAEKALKSGQTYLAENKSKPGVTTLPSGVQYKVVNSGTGKTPKATDTVVTNYKGTLIDGTEFDSGKAEFNVGEVIPGWTEILQKMKVGDKWSVAIPAALAYGARGYPPKIAPNSVLLFDMELLEVK